MTTALDLLVSGEIFRALAQPFVEVSGEPFFYFMVLCCASLLVYLATKTIAVTAMFFFIVSGSLVASHLTTFDGTYDLIPEPFQGMLLLIAGLGLAATILYLMRR